MDLSEQTLIQIVLCAYRFIAIFAMIVAVLAVMFQEPYENCSTVRILFMKKFTKCHSLQKTEPPYIADGFSNSFNFAGFGTVFSTCVFAQLTHHSIPGIVQPVRNKTKL